MNASVLLHGTTPVCFRQPCTPSSSGRAAKASNVVGHSLPGAGEHHSVCHTVGIVGKRNARKLHKALKISRQRFEQTNLCGSASCTMEAPTEQLAGAGLTGLEAEFQMLLRQLREIAPESGTSGGTSTAPAPSLPRPFHSAPVASPPTIDFDLPEYAPRQYKGAGRVMVCQGNKCKAKGALGVLQAVSAIVGSSEGIEVLPCKCLGKCSLGAAMRVKAEGDPKGQLYTQLQPSQVGAMLDSHFQTA